MQHRYYRSIREFVGTFQEQFPRLMHEYPQFKEQCDKYVDFYELAKFGNHKCTKQEFDEFFALFGEILNTLQRSDYN